MTRLDGQNETLGCDMRHIFDEDECYPMRELERCFSMEGSSYDCPSVGLGEDLLTINGTMSTACVNGTWEPLNMTECELPLSTVRFENLLIRNWKSLNFRVIVSL